MFGCILSAMYMGKIKLEPPSEIDGRQSIDRFGKNAVWLNRIQKKLASGASAEELKGDAFEVFQQFRKVAAQPFIDEIEKRQVLDSADRLARMFIAAGMAQHIPNQSSPDIREQVAAGWLFENY